MLQYICMNCSKVYFFFILSFLCCIVFNSCSNNHLTEELVADEVTLKSISTKTENELSWTKELESTRLVEDISKNSYIDSKVKLTPQNYIVATAEKKSRIYPCLEGFGSLDTTEINSILMNSLLSFCDSICSWNFSINQIESTDAFFLILFKHDVESDWKARFKKEFSLNSQNRLFDSFIVGKPFFEDSAIEIPIRFFCEYGYLDVKVSYLNDSFEKIEQLKIVGWGTK